MYHAVRYLVDVHRIEYVENQYSVIMYNCCFQLQLRQVLYVSLWTRCDVRVILYKVGIIHMRCWVMDRVVCMCVWMVVLFLCNVVVVVVSFTCYLGDCPCVYWYLAYGSRMPVFKVLIMRHVILFEQRQAACPCKPSEQSQGRALYTPLIPVRPSSCLVHLDSPHLITS